MNMQCLCNWGLLCFIQGIWDTVKLIDILVRLHGPLFKLSAGFWYNLPGVVLVGVPLTMFPGAMFGWYFYQDAFGYQSGGGDWGRENAPLTSGSTRQTANYTAFEGSGR